MTKLARAERLSAPRTAYQSAEHWCDLARKHERNRELAPAKRAYLKAVEADATHYRAHFLLSHCLASTGELSAAAVHARRAFQLNPNPTARTHYIDVLARSALALAQVLDLHGMIDAAGELLSMGAEEPAQAVFAFAFEAAGADPEILHVICRHLFDQRRCAALIVISDARALAGIALPAEVLRLRAQAYRALGKIRAARQTYLQLLKCDSDDRNAWGELFSLGDGEADAEQIIADVTQELDANPDDMLLCRFAARLLFHLRRIEAALPLYRCLHEDGRFRSEAALRLAQISYLSGDVDAMLEYAQAADVDTARTFEIEPGATDYRVHNARFAPLRSLVPASAPLAFHHIACTGGDAFMEVIRKTGRLTCHSVPTYEKETVHTYLQRLQGSDLQGHFFNGHGMYGCHLVLGRLVPYITILREPSNRFISEFFWEQRSDPRLAEGQHQLLDDLCRYIDSLEQANLQVYELAQFHHERPIDTPHLRPELFSIYSIDTAFRIAQERIRDHFCFVAVTELFEESVFLLFDMLGWPCVEMWSRGPHATGRGASATKLGFADLPERSRQRLERLVQADRALYDQRRAVIARLFQEADFGEAFARYRSDARQR
jgi:tetratricopeptide (TPR) repeat protein